MKIIEKDLLDQHRKDGNKEVGLYKEWHKVEVLGKFVTFSLEKQQDCDILNYGKRDTI